MNWIARTTRDGGELKHEPKKGDNSGNNNRDEYITRMQTLSISIVYHKRTCHVRFLE